MIVNLVKFATSASVSTVVSNLIKMSTPKDLSLVNKGMVMIGSLVLTSLAGDAAANHVAKGIEKRFAPKPTNEEK